MTPQVFDIAPPGPVVTATNQTDLDEDMLISVLKYLELNAVWEEEKKMAEDFRSYIERL